MIKHFPKILASEEKATTTIVASRKRDKSPRLRVAHRPLWVYPVIPRGTAV